MDEFIDYMFLYCVIRRRMPERLRFYAELCHDVFRSVHSLSYPFRYLVYRFIAKTEFSDYIRLDLSNEVHEVSYLFRYETRSLYKKLTSLINMKNLYLSGSYLFDMTVNYLNEKAGSEVNIVGVGCDLVKLLVKEPWRNTQLRSELFNALREDREFVEWFQNVCKYNRSMIDSLLYLSDFYDDIMKCSEFNYRSTFAVLFKCLIETNHFLLLLKEYEHEGELR